MSFELAKAMGRLGTESAFSVLAEAKKLDLLKKQEEQQANAELIKQLKLLKNEERKLEKKYNILKNKSELISI